PRLRTAAQTEGEGVSPRQRPRTAVRGLISSLLGGLLEVLLGTLDVGLNGRGALRPAGRADLAELLEMLQRVEHPQRLVDAPAEGQVVDRDRADDPLLIDNERAAEGDPAFEQHAVIAADFLVEIRDEGVAQAAEAALLARRLDPR